MRPSRQATQPGSEYRPPGQSRRHSALRPSRTTLPQEKRCADAATPRHSAARRRTARGFPELVPPAGTRGTAGAGPTMRPSRQATRPGTACGPPGQSRHRSALRTSRTTLTQEKQCADVPTPRHSAARRWDVTQFAPERPGFGMGLAMSRSMREAPLRPCRRRQLPPLRSSHEQSSTHPADRTDLDACRPRRTPSWRWDLGVDGVEPVEHQLRMGRHNRDARRGHALDRHDRRCHLPARTLAHPQIGRSHVCPRELVAKGLLPSVYLSRLRDSNPQPPLYKSGALPIAPSRQCDHLTWVRRAVFHARGKASAPARRSQSHDDPAACAPYGVGVGTGLGVAL